MNRCWATGYMKADSNIPKELTGRVILSLSSPGSKSEHEGVYLETTQGTFLLRKKGGNPFNDPTLKQFVGQQVTVTGTLERNLLLADKIESTGNH